MQNDSTKRFASFSEWQESVKAQLTEDDMCVRCPDCDGEGEVFDECPCCNRERECECDRCDGDGYVTYSDSGALIHPDLSRSAYIRDVTGTLKRACVSAGWDFLDMAAIFCNEQKGKY